MYEKLYFNTFLVFFFLVGLYDIKILFIGAFRTLEVPK